MYKNRNAIKDRIHKIMSGINRQIVTQDMLKKRSPFRKSIKCPMDMRSDSDDTVKSEEEIIKSVRFAIDETSKPRKRINTEFANVGLQKYWGFSKTAAELEFTKFRKQLLEREKEREREHEKERQMEMQKFKLAAKAIWKQDNTVALPRNPRTPYHSRRPVIYFDIEVKDVGALGRVMIQLYTEACPEAVWELVRICDSQQYDRVIIPRVFHDLWVAGEILLNGNKMRSSKIDYDMYALSHNSAGILSFPKYLLKGCRERSLTFSISFRPLRVLEGHRLPFGKVIRGQEIINALEEYGSRNGLLRRQILITAVGSIED